MITSCPAVDKHTPCPSGYVAWHEWAERMGETHSQTRCPACGLLAIWKPKKPDNFREEWNKIARDGGARPRVVVVPVPLIDAVKPVSE